MNYMYYKILNKLYKCFSCCFFWIMRFVIVLYILQNDKIIQFINSFISKESGISIMVAIIVVVWTFTMGMSTYCLGKLDNKFYGIRLVDILMSQVHPVTLVIISVTILSELFAVFIFATCGNSAMVFVIGILQFLAMLYAVLMIYIETSRITVIERIKEGLEKGISANKCCQLNKRKYNACRTLFFCMIRNLDYTDNDDVNMFFSLIENIVSECYKNDWHAIYVITHDILLDKTQKVARMNFIKKWSEWANEDKRKSDFLMVKKGIMIAVVEILSPERFHYLMDLLDMQKYDDKEICIWCIAANIYYERFAGQEWRSIFTKKMIIGLMRNNPIENEILINLKYIAEEFDRTYNLSHNNFSYTRKYF